jgi:hypothetical protein
MPSSKPDADGGKRNRRIVAAGDDRGFRVGPRNAVGVFEDGNRELAEDGSVNGALIASVKEEIGGHLQGGGRGECGKIPRGR